MLGFGIQMNNGGVHAGPAGLWAPLLLIVAGAAVGGLMLPIVRFLVTRGRAAVRAGGHGGDGSRPLSGPSAVRGR